MGILEKIFGTKRSKDPGKLGRNDPCWCGSGKKYKKCHLAQDQKERSAETAATCQIGKG